MISAVFLLQAVPVATEAAPPPEVAAQIEVIGRRLDTWKGSMKRRKDGQFACKITASSGDAEIDAIRCNAMRYCGAQVDARIQAVAGLKLAKAERNRRINALAQEMQPCMADYEDATVTRLAWERAGE